MVRTMGRGVTWVWVWAVVGVGALDVAVCVRGRGRVGLGSHDPSKRREGRVDVLLLFFHVQRSRVWLGKGKE
jgi:hypothetical protein